MKDAQTGTVGDLANRMRQYVSDTGPRPITFLIGAGCSVSAGVPVGSDIAKKLVLLLAERNTGKTYKDVAQALATLGGLGILAGHKKLAERGEKFVDWGQVYDALFEEVYSAPDDCRDVFKKIIKDADPKINWAHLALGELAAENWIATTICTNFDLLALEGYSRAGVVPVVSDGIESLDRIDPKPETPQLVQINGSIHSYRLRNSAADLNGVATSSAAITCFRSLFQNSRVLVVIGYEGREPQIMDLLIDAAKSYPDKHIFWSLYDKNPAKLSNAAREFLSHSDNARLLLGQDADLFFFELCEELGVGIPLALRDPLQFHVRRLESIFTPKDPASGPIAAAISRHRDKLEALRHCEENPSPSKKPKPGSRDRAAPSRRSRKKTIPNEPSANPEVEADRLFEELKDTHSDSQESLFKALREAQDDLYVSGRDKGIAFDLDVSIHLALEERTRDRVPLQWAMTQNNLGTALQALGAREADTTRLEEAVAVYRAALEERIRDRVPLDWAMTQNNLGNALQALGAREADTTHLEKAVAAYRAALEVFQSAGAEFYIQVATDNLAQTEALIAAHREKS